MSKLENSKWLLTDWVTVRGGDSTRSAIAAGESDWIDLGDIGEILVESETSEITRALPKPPPRRDAPELQGLRIMKCDRWKYDLVERTDVDGSTRWRKVRFGESRGWRRGAVVQRAPRRARK